MPLISFWKADPQAVKQLTIEQLIATAGDGRLQDGSECQDELREYLRQVNVESLAAYADFCLSTSFNKSGHALQDIVNELGRRLEYTVTNGRYQGTTSTVGFDGLWEDPAGHSVVVEVKTTDAYRLSLDKVVGYRDQLMGQGRLGSSSSILLVVGRTDTGELEAQVRGSRHAWHIRLISVDSLVNLVRVKESADSQQTIAKIRKVLTPIEYTRLDDLVDVMFTAAQDVETAVISEIRNPDDSEVGTETKRKSDFTPSQELQEKRELIVDVVGKHLDTSFVKKTRATYWNPDRNRRLVCTISKRYTTKGNLRYWYAYHPEWDEFLAIGKESHLVLGCMDLDIAFAFPRTVLCEHLSELWTTEKKDGSGHYWHLTIIEEDRRKYALQLPHASQNLPLDEYVVPLRQGKIANR